jgi:hypothetical protein
MGERKIVTNTMRRREARRRRQFVKFPLDWADRLKAVKRISSYRVALYLLYQDFRTSGKPVTLSNVALRGAGVSARQKWPALAELERIELIEVKRRPRKSPIVKLNPSSV